MEKYKPKSPSEILEPSLEEQTARILAGKCPHNRGWAYDGHSHNDDSYRCLLCGEIEFL